MELRNPTFIQGVVSETAVVYDGTPHIAFIGRSNVGKSSTLNAVVGSRGLVKVGNTPGKTREINFFRVSLFKEKEHVKDAYLVDLPGYGYAKLSKEKRKELSGLIEWYLKHPEADTAVICMIIDAKVGVTDMDNEMIDLIQAQGKHLFLAVNKIDKLNQKARHKLNLDLEASLGSRKIPYMLYSAVKKKHIDQLVGSLVQYLSI